MQFKKSAGADGAGSPRRDRGESLIEVVLTVLITGVTVTALVSSLATAGNAGTSQRNGSKIDTVLRNYAEATKSGEKTCVAGSGLAVTYVPPAGFQVSSTPSGPSCPPVTTTQRLTLQVTAPDGAVKRLDVRVRTP